MNSQKNQRNCLILTLALLLMSGLGQAAEVISTTYYHHDALGSPIAATDDEGKLLWRESYYPYGERIQNDPKALNNARWFTGHPQDAESGLIYMGARYYDPRIGRFMAIDPVGYQQDNLHSFNRYAYANNNPYRYIDPDGKAANVLTYPAGRATVAPAIDILISFATARRYLSLGQAIHAAINGSDAGNAEDSVRIEGQKDNRRKRRERKSRGETGNGQKQSGEGSRDHENANKGSSGERPKGPNRKDNRERNKGINEEHSIKPKGTPVAH